jgi:sulfite reductase alpha subunit-like flavoprotein
MIFSCSNSILMNCCLGITRTWENHEKIPMCSLRTLLQRFMDITSPPSRQFLTFLSSFCENKVDKEQMEKLSNETEAYEDWKHDKLPHILEVFNEFPSCRPPVALFIANLNPLQPRFYSISSSQRKYPNEVHLTVAIVKYKTNGKIPCNNSSMLSGKFLIKSLSLALTQMDEVNLVLVYVQTIWKD